MVVYLITANHPISPTGRSHRREPVYASIVSQEARLNEAAATWSATTIDHPLSPFLGYNLQVNKPPWTPRERDPVLRDLLDAFSTDCWGRLSNHDPGCETHIYLVPHMGGLPQPAMKDMSVHQNADTGNRPAFVGHLGGGPFSGGSVVGNMAPASVKLPAG
jgi:hypothetical protein